MGAELITDLDGGTEDSLGAPYLPTEEENIPVVPWLDQEPAGLVRTIITTVTYRHPDLRAVILYGSIARHEERPLDDAEPSDVDLLLVFDLEPALERMPHERLLAIFDSVGLARDRYPSPPREVQVMPVIRDLADWDPTFVAAVARDGLLLWARGPLPAPLAPVAARHGPRMHGPAGGSRA